MFLTENSFLSKDEEDEVEDEVEDEAEDDEEDVSGSSLRGVCGLPKLVNNGPVSSSSGLRGLGAVVK
tara:strand:- start:126 stop:326 length:201 start_codon:yes stop_codon:yes gene_type:complete